MKQHHQRILRLWRCPECDRTVRLPGRVTTRTCRCKGEATMMQLQQTDRIRKFDIDSFVSYQSEEDVTPTAAELVEEIPKHLMPIGPTEEEIAAKAAKPRRGKAYLRTEIDEEAAASAVTKSPAPEVDDFGVGIESDLPTSTTETKQPDSSDGSKAITADSGAESESPSEGTGKKRKRRRRRRGRGAGRRDGDQQDQSSPADETDAGSADATDNKISVRENKAVSTADAAEGESASTNSAGKKRRRRRRRRGKGGSSNAAASDTASENSNHTASSGNKDDGNSAPDAPA